MTSKIALAGAGSHFTPGVLRDLIHSKVLGSSELTLMDPNPDALDISSRLGLRMIDQAGSDLQLDSTTDLARSLESADFVITTILVGGLDVCKTDIDIPLKYGIYQSTGDTVGPGGFIRALRTVPAIVEIAETMEDVCPDAWLFNYSNPLSCLSIAVRETTDLKSVGLCHGWKGTEGALSRFLEVDPGHMDFIATGVNHLTWMLDIRENGEDIYPELRSRLQDENVPGWPISSDLCRIFGYFPSPGDRHIAEFFPHFLTERANKGADYGLELRDIEGRISSKIERTKEMTAQANGDAPLGNLDRPSGEEVVAIMECLAGDREREFVVNVPNRGYVDNLPGEAVIEVHALIGPRGLRGIHIGNLPPGLAAITASRIRQQELTVKAALAGNRNLALQALILDPVVRSIEDAESMLEELMEASSDYLPQF